MPIEAYGKSGFFPTEGVTLSGVFNKDRKWTAFWRNSYEDRRGKGKYFL